MPLYFQTFKIKMKLQILITGLIAMSGAQSNSRCPEGFVENSIETSFDFTCDDIDECTLGTHTCSDDATCINTAGGYTCKCNSGKRSNYDHQIMVVNI